MMTCVLPASACTSCPPASSTGPAWGQPGDSLETYLSVHLALGSGPDVFCFAICKVGGSSLALLDGLSVGPD